jgi:hypothetical protein
LIFGIMCRQKMNGNKSADKRGDPIEPARVPPVVVDGNDKAAETNSSEKISKYSRAGDWFKKLAEPLTVVTALLFFSTAWLAWKTHELVNDAEHTAERQLRAYVIITDLGVFCPDCGDTALKTDILPELKNSVRYRYRRMADQAEQSARTTRDLSAQRMYDQIADHYRYLADQQVLMDGFQRRHAKD